MPAFIVAGPCGNKTISLGSVFAQELLGFKNGFGVRYDLGPPPFDVDATLGRYEFGCVKLASIPFFEIRAGFGKEDMREALFIDPIPRDRTG